MASVVRYRCPRCFFGRAGFKGCEGQCRTVQHQHEKSFPGNVLCALAATTTGTRFNELRRWAKQKRLEFISDSFCWKWFKCCKPAIEEVYLSQQRKVLERVRMKYAEGEGLQLTADGAFNSRGYNALFGKVLLVDLKTKLILHTEVLHRSETNGNSSLMEQEGLRRLLRWLISKGWTIASLTMDRNL
ncbi:hypothetical protein OESDEN_08120 [Oesophagostomum dentatum]|uniref:Uncharacterized protein n=1 Tax=Oesophagostomum dentatum TaxID=61180 RepID=A0A0B1T771_OESDE|nr:hypothetical protein OESDEN_08120 [Oesophagostomum dentatum]